MIEEKAVRVVLTKGDAYISNGSGGYGGELSGKLLADIFGGEQVIYITNIDPREKNMKVRDDSCTIR